MTTGPGRIPYIDRFSNVRLPPLSAVLNRARQIASKVPFADDVVALYFCARDRAIPLKIKASIVASLAYLVLPVDVIPDFIVGIGFTDDAAVLTALYALVSNHITDDHRALARKALAGSPPTDERT